MKKNPGLTPEELANFLDCLMASFENGWTARSKGKSEEQIFIHFDITAAGSPELSRRLTRMHRTCVKNGIEAFNANVPLNFARGRMRIRLLSEAYKLLREIK